MIRADADKKRHDIEWTARLEGFGDSEERALCTEQVRYLSSILQPSFAYDLSRAEARRSNSLVLN